MTSNTPKAPNNSHAPNPAQPKSAPLSSYYYQQTGIQRAAASNLNQPYQAPSASAAYPTTVYTTSPGLSSSELRVAGYSRKQIPLPQGQIQFSGRSQGGYIASAVPVDASGRVIHQAPLSQNPVSAHAARVIVHQQPNILQSSQQIHIQQQANHLPAQSVSKPTPVQPPPTVSSIPSSFQNTIISQTSAIPATDIQRPPTVVNLRDQYHHIYNPPTQPAASTQHSAPVGRRITDSAAIAAKGSPSIQIRTPISISSASSRLNSVDNIPRPPTVEGLAGLVSGSVPTSNNLRDQFQDIYLGNSPPQANASPTVPLPTPNPGPYAYNIPKSSQRQVHTKQASVSTARGTPSPHKSTQQQPSASSTSPTSRKFVPRSPAAHSITLKSAPSDPLLQPGGDREKESESFSLEANSSARNSRNEVQNQSKSAILSLPDSANDSFHSEDFSKRNSAVDRDEQGVALENHPRASPSADTSLEYLKANKRHLQQKIAALEAKIIEETGPKRKVLLARQSEAKESCSKAEAIRSGDWRDQAHFLQQQLEVLGSLKKSLFQENANLRVESKKQHKAAGLRYFCLRCSSTADIVCLPCRHLACCSNCIDLSNECPKCHAEIEESFQVFVP